MHRLRTVSDCCGLLSPGQSVPAVPPGSRARAVGHYASNTTYYVAKAKARRALVVVEVRDWVLRHLRAHPCVDCGEDDVRVLEFDHRDGAVKGAAVAVLARGGYSLDRVRSEIVQCDVRRANCHRRRTHEQRGWWGAMLTRIEDQGCARRDSNP